MLGQDWSLCPISPTALREQGGGTMAAILCQLMRHAGAIRIDHVMGLDRLYWIPLGLTAADGAYVSYPEELLKHQLASASQDHSTLVIGEDLGTVPAGFREAMRQREIQGYRVFYFERSEDREFREPAAYARETLACISTHDLPTLRGWWTDMDICERERLGLFDAASAKYQREERARDRVRLFRALKRADLLIGELASGLTVASVPAELSDDILIALHAFLARAPSRLVAVQIEDLIGMEAQANLPGTIDEHPNWRRKLPVSLEELSGCETFKRVVQVVSAERHRAS
jgi:4-alpha-glucanotransferase